MTVTPGSAAGVGGVVAALAFLSGPPSLPQQVFRSSIDLVSVDVAVRAGSAPVTGLTSQDFELLDNGVRQSIDAIAVEEIPVDLTLILDVSASTSPVINRFKTRAQQVAAMLRPGDRVRLLSFATEVAEVFTLRAPGDRLPVDKLAARGGTSLHDALLLSLVRPPAEGRRQLIVAFTDGLDTMSVVPAESVATVAGRSDGVLHLVLSGYPGTLPPTARALRTAAEETGGELHVPGAFDDAVDAFRQVFEDFRQSYVLRYILGGVERRGWHDVTVSVIKPAGRRYTIRARRGYFGG